ncbi:MAG: hypothetical protein HY567_03160 [Candidatus Kerfeldbacteria bacterium]|nr:hypothetical protein [Candidatus Kerfeldbacteria bacterium]
MATRSLPFEDQVGRALSFRIWRQLPDWFPLTLEICRQAAGDLSRDGVCETIPDDDLTHCHSVGEFRACISRHHITPAGSS